MIRKATTLLGTVALIVCAALPGRTVAAVDPCANGLCCVNPATCVVTDKQTLAALTVDSVVPCTYTLGTHCFGGGSNGIAPNPPGSCGLNFLTDNATTQAVAINALDHRWLQSTTAPKVVDFGVPVNSAIVFVAVDHGPFPEEGIESTVWGSNSCDTSTFPNGWTLGTLTTIWKRGWEDPVGCQGVDNADDYVGQYSFPGVGFRYVAVYANLSISIFDDPTHTTYTAASDDAPVTLGWQSADDEIDAVGTPDCSPGQVVASAGPPQIAAIGQQICFDASTSTANAGIASYGWDLDGDGAIDVSGPQACINCDQESAGQVTLFVTDACGCVDSDTVDYTCTDRGACCDPSQHPDNVCTDDVEIGTCTTDFFRGRTCDDVRATLECVSDIPAVSEWGLLLLALTGMVAGTLLFRRPATA